MSYGNLNMGAVVQGVLHVDDTLILSRIHCTSCLWKNIQRIWPEDVGLTLEGEGPTFSFLHTEVCIVNDGRFGEIGVKPLMKSTAFASGEEDFPSYSKLAPYVLPHVQSVKTLSAVVWTKLSTYDQVLVRKLETCAECLNVLVSERSRRD